jgi:acetyl esterase/lipase
LTTKRDKAWAAAFLLVPLVALILYWLTERASAFATEPGERTAIIAVHGGGWYAGTPASMDAVCAEIAVPLGVDCFQPTYTLSGVDSFNAAPADLKAYAEDLRAQGYTKLIGIGSSAGGNLVAWMATKGLLDVAVTMSAPTRLTTLADWYRSACSCYVINQYAPTSTMKLNASPALHTVAIPILIIHSELEATIPKLQAYKLQEVSAQGTLMILPGDTRHGMAYFEDVKDDILAFLTGL